MTDTRALLQRTAELAADYLDSLEERPVFPQVSVDELRKSLGVPLQDEPLAPEQVVEELAAAADPGLVAMPSGRYFGFVIGGGLPAALASDWLAAAWDQNAGAFAVSPASATVEDVCGGWLKDVLELPADASFALVTGCQMAHVTCLLAARHALLERRGWDVEAKGLFGAPTIRVLTSDHHHASLARATPLGHMPPMPRLVRKRRMRSCEGDCASQQAAVNSE